MKSGGIRHRQVVRPSSVTRRRATTWFGLGTLKGGARPANRCLPASETTMKNYYIEALEALHTQVGERNTRLLSLAWKAKRAGVEKDEAYDDIMEYCGEPPLDPEEVERALDRVYDHPENYTRDRRRARRFARKEPPQSGFVRRVLETVKEPCSYDTIRARSPIPIPSDPYEQATSALTTLYDKDEFVFVGEVFQTVVKPVHVWLDDLGAKNPDFWPHFMGTNPYTGKTAMAPTTGKESCRCKASVLHRRHALIEFDKMTLENQARFWTAVLEMKLFDVKSIVASGNKSLHGLILLDAPDVVTWSQYWTRLEKLLHSPLDPPEEQNDLACRNEDRMTRLPGAIRLETGLRQELLYLAPRTEA